MSSSFPRIVALFVAGFVLASAASAQFTLSEISVNPPGTDQTQEYLEIRGPTNASLSGYWFLAIEGDGPLAGVVDQAINLSAMSLGANGLLLVRDDYSTILPGPDASTSLYVLDFTPDLENGTSTFVLGTGTPPSVGSDLDSNGDGILDAGTIPGFNAVDSVTIVENDGPGNFAYADDLGGFVFPQFTWTPDAVYRIYDGTATATVWSGGDVVGPVGGPYAWALPSAIYQLESCSLDPGQFNQNVPDIDGDGVPDACDDVTSYCFGDTGNCPCGNYGATGNGCPSGINPAGANLASNGTPSLSADSLVLVGTGMPNSSALYFQGTNEIAGGGAAFGDGLRCAGGVTIRLGTKMNAGGASHYPGVGDATISVRGSIFGAGATRTYQVWYRNANAFCNPETFNLTNGVAVLWGV